MPKKDKGGIPTPDVIDPPETMTMTLCIPKNKDHMMAFFGALWELTMWDSWQPDTAHTGKELAAVWYRYWLSWDRSMNDLECEDGMAKCCVEPVTLHRINTETGRPEISVDDGVTWQEDPADVQNQIQLLPPLVTEGGSNTKCNAATNAADHIDELITATGENLTTASTVFGLAVGIAEAILAAFLIFVSAGTLTAPVTAVATAIWVAATQLFALGIAAYEAYWTTDKHDVLFCAVYCNIGDNGQFTEAQYQAFRSKVLSTLPASPALDIVMTAINSGGAVGLSQMASYGSGAIRDCDSCVCNDWCSNKFEIRFNDPSLGIITEVGEDYIIAETTTPQPNGVYYISMWTGEENYLDCCYVNSIEVLTGSASVNIGTACNNNGVPAVLLLPACLWWIEPQSNVPFSVRINLGECP
jgi:hypothetical protein